MSKNALFSEENDVTSAVDQAATDETVVSPWLTAGDANKFAALVFAGAGATTVDAKLEQAKDDSGTDAKDIDGKAITQIEAAGGGALINLREDELDKNNGFEYYRLSATVVGSCNLVLSTISAFLDYEPVQAVVEIIE